MNAAAFTKIILGAGSRGPDVSRAGATDSSDTNDLVSFGGQNKKMSNTQAINRLW